MVRNIYPKFVFEKVARDHRLLPVHKQYDIEKFLNLQLFNFIFVYVFGLMLGVPWWLSLIIAVSFAYLLYYFGTKHVIAKRAKQLEYDAIVFFESLALSLVSGANLEKAIEISTANTEGALTDEFERMLLDMKFGKTIDECLTDMTKRIPSHMINNAIMNMNQSLKLGTDVVANLYNQIDYLQELEVNEIIRKANLVPMKIMLLSVLVMIPLIIIILFSPEIIYLLG